MGREIIEQLGRVFDARGSSDLGKARRERTSRPPNYSMKLTSSLRSDDASLRPTAVLLRLRRNAPWGCSLSRAPLGANLNNVSILWHSDLQRI